MIEAKMVTTPRWPQSCIKVLYVYAQCIFFRVLIWCYDMWYRLSDGDLTLILWGAMVPWHVVGVVLWFYELVLWFYELVLWLYESVLWFYELVLWLYELVLWVGAMALWVGAMVLSCWCYGSELLVLWFYMSVLWFYELVLWFYQSSHRTSRFYELLVLWFYELVLWFYELVLWFYELVLWFYELVFLCYVKKVWVVTPQWQHINENQESDLK